MINLMIKDEKQMSVSGFENQIRLNPSYTIDVLARLKETEGEEYGLLIGADSMLNLHLWHEAEKLVDSVEILCYPRNQAEVTREKLLPYWDEKRVDKLLNSMINGTFFEISSTEIKNSMEISPLTHHIIQPENLHPDTAAYIKEKQLYLKK